MTNSKNLSITALSIVLFISLGSSYGQNVPACDISVTAGVVPATKGKSNGEISLEFGSGVSSRSVKVFLAEPFAKEAWKEVENNKVTGLKEGFYDLLIVDTSRKECVKQLTVEIKSN